MSAESATSVPKAVSAAQIAARAVSANQKRRAEAEARARALPKGTTWALCCSRAVGPGKENRHVGIIFCEGVDPRTENLIHPGMWFASYHKPEDPLFGKAGDIICDQCLAEGGEKFPLRVDYVDGKELGLCFRVPSHWHHLLFELALPEDQHAEIAQPEPPKPTKAVKP